MGWRGGVVIVSAPSTSPSPTLYLNGNKSKSDERGTKNSIIWRPHYPQQCTSSVLISHGSLCPLFACIPSIIVWDFSWKTLKFPLCINRPRSKNLFFQTESSFLILSLFLSDGSCVGHTCLWCDADNLITRTVPGAIFLRCCFYRQLTASNCDSERFHISLLLATSRKDSSELPSDIHMFKLSALAGIRTRSD